MKSSIIPLIDSKFLMALVPAIAVGVAPTSAEDDDHESRSAQFSRQAWYEMNAEFTGVPSTHAVTRRFEMYNPHSREQLEEIKEMGFTQVILDWPNLQADATNVGLDVVLANWWTDETDEADIDRGFAIAKQVAPGRLAGLSMMDEPELNAPKTPLEFYEELYSKLRPRMDAIAPHARLENSHWGPNWNWTEGQYEAFVPLYRSADVMRIMPYPDLHEGPLSDVYFTMARSRRLMERADRSLPLLVILQTWTLAPDADLPTINELRVMAYQAMLSGAEAVSFFDYNPEIWNRTPRFHDQFSALMAKLTSLSDRLANSCLVTTMSENGILQTRATDQDGWTRILRVNTNRHPVDGLAALAVTESSPFRQIDASRRCTKCTKIDGREPSAAFARCRNFPPTRRRSLRLNRRR